jgi:6-phosphogluconolactonase (cycloisomerase 2 family)
VQSPDGRFIYAANRLHDTIAWFSIGGTTMSDFDASCLTSVKELSARQIAAVSKRTGVSQASPISNGR